MIAKGGAWQTAEMSLRLAVCSSAEREKLIAGIVAHLHKVARPRNSKFFAGGRPSDWYAVKAFSVPVDSKPSTAVRHPSGLQATEAANSIRRQIQKPFRPLLAMSATHAAGKTGSRRIAPRTAL